MPDHYEQVGVAMTCRSYDEYVRMFGLEEAALRTAAPVLDAAGGASSFTAELRGKGISAYAADPLYRMSAEEIVRHGEQEIEISTGKLAKLADRYDWSYYGDLGRHRANRIRSLERFANDYRDEASREAYRYGLLPRLPFADHTFGLVVCSHFLFLYAEQFDGKFHREAVRELVRVCRPGGEVRIYPLVSLGYKPFPTLPAMIAELETDGIHCRKVPSQLPFLPGSTDLLVLQK